MSSTQPAPDSLQRAVLSLLIDRFGDRAEQVLRTCTAMGATAPDDLVDLPREWGVGRLEDPSPACLKLMCRQVAAATGTLTRVPVDCTWGELEHFLVEHCSVARRRFKQTQCWHVFLGLLEGAPPMLTLLVPPRSGGSWAAWGARQPTARYDGAGVYTPGMRVDVQRLLELDFLPADLRLALVEGHRYRWSQWPARCHKPNYRSCEDNIEHAAPEFARLIDMGLVEGPLDYVPWVVNPIACIVKWEPFKVRNVMDSLRSGVNECMVRVMCELDMVDSVVPQLLRNMGISKLDLTDAFLCWPVHVRDCRAFVIRALGRFTGTGTCLSA